MTFSFSFLNCFSSPAENEFADESENGGPNLQNFRVFSYKGLEIATRGFSNKLGEGGFGSVYKGQLKDGTMVAVKALSLEPGTMQGEKEFISELAALSNIRHENLVTLHGCCVHGANRYLVYAYMENNCLAHTLLGGEQNRSKFSWRLRWDISVGIARGLAYLHEEADPYVVHRDIKASNILLDRNFIPRVSDFGLSRLLRENASYISTGVAGTLGHLAPEYAMTGHFTRKSDVYGFGVLLLEIISGRAVVDFNSEHEELYLVEKAWEGYKGNNLLQLVDPILNGDFPEEEAVRLLTVGLLCVQERASSRPKMSVAVKMLTNEIEIEGSDVSRPGLLMDLKNVKVAQSNISESSSFGKSTRSSNFF